MSMVVAWGSRSSPSEPLILLTLLSLPNTLLHATAIIVAGPAGPAEYRFQPVEAVPAGPARAGSPIRRDRSPARGRRFAPPTRRLPTATVADGTVYRPQYP